MCSSTTPVSPRDAAPGMSEEDWDLVLDINPGRILCTKAAIKVMLKQRSSHRQHRVRRRMGQARQATTRHRWPDRPDRRWRWNRNIR